MTRRVACGGGRGCPFRSRSSLHSTDLGSGHSGSERPFSAQLTPDDGAAFPGRSLPLASLERPGPTLVEKGLQEPLQAGADPAVQLSPHPCSALPLPHSLTPLSKRVPSERTSLFMATGFSLG